MNGYGNVNGSSNGSKRFNLTYDSYPQQANEWERFRTIHNSRTVPNWESEAEWEIQEASHYPDSKVASARRPDGSFRQVLQSIRQVARVTTPIAQQLAPIVARTLLGRASQSRLPNPMAHRLIQVLLQMGELETEYLEAEFFGINAAEAEVSDSTAAEAAALTEVLAAEASHSHHLSEAAAFLGTIVPIVLESIGGRRQLRSLIPVLIADTARLVELLHCRKATRLFRLIPTILRRTIVSLRSASRLGHSITPTLARRMFAAHAARVFGNARLVRYALIRNAVIRQRSVAGAIR